MKIYGNISRVYPFKIKRALFFSLVLLAGSVFCFYGCYPLREYGSSDKGFVGVLFKHQLGKGNKVKDYFITSSNSIINIGDKYSYIIAILGEPDSDKLTMEGYRVLVYKKAGVVFYLDKGDVKYIYGYRSNNKKTKGK